MARATDTPSSRRGDAPQDPLIQVGTPIAGKIHRDSTTQPVSTAAGISHSQLTRLLRSFMRLVPQESDRRSLLLNYIPIQE